MPGRWVDAGDLRVGDVLYLKSGALAPIEELTLRHVREMVYNFQVEELESYAVGSGAVLLHNNSGDNPSPLIYELNPKHRLNAQSTPSGVSSPAPTNGQSALDNSVQVQPNSGRRVGVDPVSQEIVVFDEHRPGKFHGHVREWNELHPKMKKALVRSGLTTTKGRIKCP